MALMVGDDNVAVGKDKADSAEVGAATVVVPEQAGENRAASASKIKSVETHWVYDYFQLWRDANISFLYLACSFLLSCLFTAWWP